MVNNEIESRLIISKLIADFGLEKFLVMVGEQCENLGNQQTDTLTPGQTRISHKETWLVIGDRLKDLAMLARRAYICWPFRVDDAGKMVQREDGHTPFWHREAL